MFDGVGRTTVKLKLTEFNKCVLSSYCLYRVQPPKRYNAERTIRYIGCRTKILQNSLLVSIF